MQKNNLSGQYTLYFKHHIQKKQKTCTPLGIQVLVRVTGVEPAGAAPLRGPLPPCGGYNNEAAGSSWFYKKQKTCTPFGIQVLVRVTGVEPAAS